MKHEKKVTLEELKVQSFNTELSLEELDAIKGGSVGAPGGSDVPIFC